MTLILIFSTLLLKYLMMAGTAPYAILALSAKLGAAMAFNVTFMFTAQLYPTSIRSNFLI